ncbi:MAG: RNA polymerase sigma factor [Bacteroidetes bacterium]|nr:MAG: RNA polymerase sigma factor [Bacteroidota bacterium]
MQSFYLIFYTMLPISTPCQLAPHYQLVLWYKRFLYALAGKTGGSFVCSTSGPLNSGMYISLKEAISLNDEEKFKRYYLPCHKGLTMFCLGMLKDMDMAENIASETLLKFWYYPRVHEIRDIRSWLFTTAKRLCLNYLSKTARRREIDAEQKGAQVQAPAGEQLLMKADIDEIIQSTLNAKEYALWELHQQGYDNKEIAEKLGRTEKTVANTKTLIRKKLQQRLKTYQT